MHEGHTLAQADLLRSRVCLASFNLNPTCREVLLCCCRCCCLVCGDRQRRRHIHQQLPAANLLHSKHLHNDKHVAMDDDQRTATNTSTRCCIVL